MLKKTLTAFTLSFLSLLGSGWENYAAQPSQKMSDAATGTLQKMIVESGSVTLDLDLNGLNGSSSLVARPVTLHFAAAANSFFPILVFNDLLRAAETGSMTLIPQNTAGAEVNALGYSPLPAALRASLGQLAIGKMDCGRSRLISSCATARAGSFFSMSKEPSTITMPTRSCFPSLGEDFSFQKSLPTRWAGQQTPVQQLEKSRSALRCNRSKFRRSLTVKPNRWSCRRCEAQPAAEAPTLVPGPDVIVGDLPEMAQFGSNGNFVGLGIGTTSCNNGDQPLNWFALPNTDHPVIPQNLYRMSGGANNNDRFEQIGQSWLKHAFTALQGNACNFGCTPGCSGSQLCPGCSDPYSSSLNAGQTGLGSRAWVNPFTGAFPSTANNHTGHVTLARRTGSRWRRATWIHRKIPVRPISPKRNMSLRTNTRGVSRILANATCSTTPLTVSLA